MADPAHIEALQSQKAQEARAALRVEAVQRCLSLLDPQLGDGALRYPGLLKRLIAVLTQELQHQEG